MSFNKIKGFDFKRLTEAVKTEIPVIMEQSANTAKNHFLKSFRDGGFTDENLETWKPLKHLNKTRMRAIKRQKKRYDQGKSDRWDAKLGILVGKGHYLRDSIRVARIGGKGFLIVSDLGLGSSKDYAPVHNFGLRAGRGRGFKMPKRQFIGKSKVLEEKLYRRLVTKINAILNK
tara:strand:+ start:1387 stop:1908 length:522 start_codon:yes stop_codon:yes gene_type:complete